MIPTETLLSLIRMAEEHKLDSLSISTPEGKLSVSRQTLQPQGQMPVEMLHVSPVPVQEDGTEQIARLSKVVSPLMGVFYRSPSPGAQSFVEVGDSVTSGDVLCIVEAMKVMNEIVCETVGTVEKIFPQNGDVVEAGAPLFLIKTG